MRTGAWLRKGLPVGLLTILVAGFYWGTLSVPFITLDDTSYVISNEMVRKGLSIEGIRWAFTTTTATFYHPLTWLSYMLDVELWGVEPAGFHRTNLVLHLVATLLFFAFLRTATGWMWPSLLAAALFGVHPVHVEPVAWVASRKDVLSGGLAMATLVAYARTARHPSLRGNASVVGFFVLTVLAKPYLVTLPATLLLLDLWPLQRLRLAAGFWARTRPLIFEKAPLFAVALAIGLWNHQLMAAEPVDLRVIEVGLLQRIGNAFVLIRDYLLNVTWPTQLAIEYPLPAVQPLPIACGSALLVASLTAIAVWQSTSRPYLLVGWAWFLVSIAPALNITRQVGVQAMADRFLYFPIAGLCVAASWLLCSVLARFDVRDAKARTRRRALGAAVVAAVAVALLGLTSRDLLERWQSSVTLYRHAIEVQGENERNLVLLAEAMLEVREYEKAEEALVASLRIQPDSFKAVRMMTKLLLRKGRHDELIRYHQHLPYREGSAFSEHMARGSLLYALLRHEKLVEGYRESTGRRVIDDAALHYRAAAELRTDGPHVVAALLRLLSIEMREGNYESAVEVGSRLKALDALTPDAHRAVDNALRHLADPSSERSTSERGRNP